MVELGLFPHLQHCLTLVMKKVNKEYHDIKHLSVTSGTIRYFLFSNYVVSFLNTR